MPPSLYQHTSNQYLMILPNNILRSHILQLILPTLHNLLPNYTLHLPRNLYSNYPPQPLPSSYIKNSDLRQRSSNGQKTSNINKKYLRQRSTNGQYNSLNLFYKFTYNPITNIILSNSIPSNLLIQP